MIKINILYNFIDGPYGGTNQFLKALRKEFVRMGCNEDNPRKADAILFNAFPFGFEFKALNALSEAKNKNIIIVHRIDGPISKYRGRDKYIDDNIYYLNKIFADGTIFQSEYSQKANYQLGFDQKKYETVIQNAPDPEIFNTNDRIPFSTDRKIKLIATSWSPNWNKGFDVYQWLDENLDFNKHEMTFIGNSPVKFKNITQKEPLASRDLADQLKKHDLFIIASKNDPCSNALLEALHCGLPALALNSGGHPAIVGDGGKIFNTADEIPAMIRDIVHDYALYQNKIALPDLTAVADKYLNFISGLCQKRASAEYTPNSLAKSKVMALKMKISQQKLTSLIRDVVPKIFRSK